MYSIKMKMNFIHEVTFNKLITPTSTINRTIEFIKKNKNQKFLIIKLILRM